VEIDDIIHWLRHSDEYVAQNSRLEPGVIFEGKPGTGKTLVSRYIATASGAMFINVRDFDHEGSLFRDRDIADLFNRCRQRYADTKKPIVLFWDEFEGVAIDRSDADPERASTVSQITAELDGVQGKNEGLLLIGCTNYIFDIDEALKRGGRMGLQIEFNPPDREGKQEILAYYLKALKTDGDIDVETLSYCFDSDATAADIEEACVEAWRRAVKRTIDTKESNMALTQKDLMDIFIKRLVGPPTSFISLPEKDRHGVAVHECGHAIMAAVYDIPLRLITVQPGKKSLGRVFTMELREHITTVDEYISQMRVDVGSIAAEAMADLPAISGTSEDIASVNRIASWLVHHLSVGKQTGLYHPGVQANNRQYNSSFGSPTNSEKLAVAMDEDVQGLLKGVSDDAATTMEKIGKDNLHAIAKRINEKTTLTGNEFKAELAEVLGTDDFSQYR
jgi:cell division protease FtsH